VIKVVDDNKVRVRYAKPGGAVVTPIMTKTNHGMKLNEDIVITLNKTTLFALVGISKKI
jgi:hypothetical protein